MTAEALPQTAATEAKSAFDAIDRAHRNWQSARYGMPSPSTDADYAAERKAFAAWLAEVRKVETPEQTAARLIAQAEGFDTSEAYHMRQEESLRDRAVRCAERNPEQAANLRRQREVSMKCAKQAAANAEACRTEAARIRDTKALLGVVL